MFLSIRFFGIFCFIVHSHIISLKSIQLIDKSDILAIIFVFKELFIVILMINKNYDTMTEIYIHYIRVKL
jgi:hypothetical protein